MITASIVLYKTDNHDLEKVVNSYNPVKDRLLYLIDNSPDKSALPEKIINNPFINYIFLNKNVGYGSGHNIAFEGITDNDQNSLFNLAYVAADFIFKLNNWKQINIFYKINARDEFFNQYDKNYFSDYLIREGL